MAVRPAQHQAIAFNPYGQDDFINSGLCKCPRADNDWRYIIKAGDVTPIQFLNDCEGIEYGADLISNGGFEQGDAEEPITDWTIFNENTELSEVSRSTNDPYEGNYSAYWTKTAPTSATCTLTQNTGNTFLAGETYLLELYARILNTHAGCGIAENLIVTVGGIEIKLTPQDNYQKFSVYITFDSNGSDSNIILAIEDFDCKDTFFMWVDNVSLKKLLSTDQCGDCSPDIMFNGDFEDGQNFENVPDVAIIQATFDGWAIIDGAVTEDLTGGVDGDRCMVLTQGGTGDGIAQSDQVLLNAQDYILTFFAKSNAPTDTLDVFLTITGTTETFNLTDQYQQFTYLFSATTDDRLQFINNDTTNISLDNVNLYFDPPNDNSLYITNTITGANYPVPPDQIDNFVGGFNVDLDYTEIFGSVDDYPSCFNVCLEPCAGQLALNGNFALGAGNIFTDWILTPGNGTIVQTVTGGILGTRAVQINNVTDSSNIAQTSLFTVGTSYIISFWAKYIAGDSGSVNLTSNTTNIGTVLLSDTFKRYSMTFTATGADSALQLSSTINNTSIIIDNVGVWPLEAYGGYCSEQFKTITDPNDCSRELIWYDTENAFGINYESGFRNVMRVPGQDFGCKIGNPAYPSEMTKTLNGSVTEISKAIIRKEVQLTMSLVPEFIHDRLAIMVRHPNIELGSTGYAPVDETIYTVIPDENGKCTLNSQVTLGIEGEILAEKTTEC